jgi:hypothetical protein
MQNAEGSGVRSPWYHRDLHGPWRTLGIVLTVVAVSWIGLGLYRIPAVEQQKKSEQTVAFIRAQKITMDDVDGKHLPPPPSPAQVDATVAGVDANNNGIRDDVELAIFKLHPDSARIRAAELQYAMAEQMYLTSVFDTETWKAVAEQLDRSYQCIGETFPRDDIQAGLRMIKELAKEVEDLTFNTQSRVRQYSSANQFQTSFGLPNGNVCDLKL